MIPKKRKINIVQFKTSLYKIIHFSIPILACLNAQMQILKRSKIFGKQVREKWE